MNKHKRKLLQLGGNGSQINHNMPFDVVEEIILFGVKVGRKCDAETRYRWDFEEINVSRFVVPGPIKIYQSKVKWL